MKMDAGLDTGAMLAKVTTPIRAEDNAQTLHDRLATLGADLLVKVIPDWVSGRIQPQPQPADGVTYARKITKEDSRLDWRLPATILWNRVRGLTPWPGTQGVLQTGAKAVPLKIWRAEATAETGEPGMILRADRDGLVVACGEGALRLLELQREGGRRLPCAEFLPGCPVKPGDRFAV